MNQYIVKAIIGVIGLLGVFFVTYKTKNPNCLWALILIALMIESV